MTLITCVHCEIVEEVSDAYAHDLTASGKDHVCTNCLIEKLPGVRIQVKGSPWLNHGEKYLAALVKKIGGRVQITTEELRAVKGMVWYTYIDSVKLEAE